MSAQIMCTDCHGAGGWGCGEDAEGCARCGGTGQVALPQSTLPAPVNGKPDAMHTDYATLAPAQSIFDKSTAETRANTERGAYLANEQAKQAHYYRHMTACAQGMGFPGITDALSALAASSDLLAAAKALATRYLKAQHDDASLCVNAAHHKAVCDLFAEIERAGKGGVAR